MDQSTGALAVTADSSHHGPDTALRTDTIRGIATVGIVVTLAVTAMLGMLSFFVGFAPTVANAMSLDMHLADAVRVGVATGLLWCPLVAAKVISPHVALVQHVHFTFGVHRTIWGYVVVGATAATTILAEITGGYGWFLLAVLLMLAWGARSGVILNRLADEEASTLHDARQAELRARLETYGHQATTLTHGALDRLRPVAHKALRKVSSVLRR